MTELKVRAVDKKHIRLSGIEPTLAFCLQQVPVILDQRDEPAAHERLFPDPTLGETKTNEDWREFVAPDLHHLFRSAGETFARDLTGLESESETSLQITFPSEHLNAWISALNEARLILGTHHGVTERDMNCDWTDLPEIKQRDVLIIQMLGWPLQLLVEFASGGSQSTTTA